jgi:alkane 1-monooxygenase
MPSSRAAAVALPPDPPAIWRDPKRHAWLWSLAVPLLVAAGPIVWLWSGLDWTLWLPAILLYGVVPLVDALLGADRSNPPEWAVPQLEADPYYRRITWVLVPLLWAAFIFEAWFVARHPLPWHGWLAMVLIGGTIGGFCINLGHELGHKTTRLERWLARVVLAPTGYGHFCIEHNRGHHRDVATPEDPASSRMGESIWRFVWREMPGAARRAWALEADRLRRNGWSPWSWRNEILQTGLITLGLWVSLVVWLGWGILPFILAMSAWANFQLTSANYVEHYGLLRQRGPDGRYERPGPQHSWNSNHVFSNWALFHLQRHSDHHTHPGRRYQSLRHFEEAPQLPSGYFGMFTLAYIPWLWFRVMDPRLLAAVGRDQRRINFDPSRREELLRRYHLTPD